jgi:adenylosuccinate synthase
LSNRINKPDAIALTFADYIDHKVFGANRPQKIAGRVAEFNRQIEDTHDVEIELIGTGPKHEDMVSFII